MKQFSLLILALLVNATAFAERPSPPNVIFILADDMAWGDLSINNGGLSRTPALDTMAGESVVIDHAYSGSPVCAPSRAAFLTGRFPHRSNCVTLNPRKHPEMTRIALDETLLPELFSAAGYHTGLVGKWHTGQGKGYHPLDRGFDEFIGFTEGWDIRTYTDYQLHFQREIRDFPEGDYLTDVFNEKAIDFVREHQDEPFFLHLAHYAPHRPLNAPENSKAPYREAGLHEDTATVYAMNEIMDRGIGELLDELDRLGLSENTLVLFSSDNGPDSLIAPRWNGENRGTKYMVNEGGIRVPFLARWSGTFEPDIVDRPLHFIDLLPTLVEICQLAHPDDALPLDGVSLAGNFHPAYSAPVPPEHLFWQWNREKPRYSHNAAIREGDWKLIRPFVTKNYPKGPAESAPRLYNLATDPSEESDLAAEHPDKARSLNHSLTDWTREVEQDRLRN